MRAPLWQRATSVAVRWLLLISICACPRRGSRRVVGPGLLTLLIATCACSSTPQVYGPTYDGGHDGGADAPIDVVTAQDAPSDAPSCASTIAFVGGSATSAFGAGGAMGSSILAAPMPGSVNDCGNDLGCANP